MDCETTQIAELHFHAGRCLQCQGKPRTQAARQLSDRLSGLGGELTATPSAVTQRRRSPDPLPSSAHRPRHPCSHPRRPGTHNPTTKLAPGSRARLAAPSCRRYSSPRPQTSTSCWAFSSSSRCLPAMACNRAAARLKVLPPPKSSCPHLGPGLTLTLPGLVFANQPPDRGGRHGGRKQSWGAGGMIPAGHG